MGYTLILTFLKSYWKHIVVIAAIAGASFMAYNHIYNIGFKDANQACEERIKKYNDDLKEKIANLESLSVTFSEENKERDMARKKDLEKLLLLVKNKPLTIVKDGNCIPSEVFIETLNAAINQANKK